VRLGYISNSTLLLRLAITPFAYFLELFYALQHSKEAQFSKSNLGIFWYLGYVDRMVYLRSNLE
jgi:hypothetical protein